ncbi:hypothetical protein BKA66DRAFT_468921 [Pyrenochaeta sp. MPI-SDFR-AT-0127]|nr:hypothetical protein BKA66DRAFT_468921 [Pyrenochaeta sp. MPI-SDFR-AT-0127]
MSWFIPFAIILAGVWAFVGILLARWLKQAGHTKPFKGKDWSETDLYGGGVGHGRDSHQVFGRSVGESSGRPVGLGQYGPGRDAGIALGQFGKGRVKGM